MKKYVFILLLSTLALKLYAPHVTIKYQKSFKEMQMERFRNLELSVDNVFLYCKAVGIKHPEVVIRQFILETGWGKSYVCKNYNNLFGFMKYSKDEGKYVYFKYSHWTESVEAYKNFQSRKYKGGCYYTFLDNVGYAEAENYTQVLKTIKINV